MSNTHENIIEAARKYVQLEMPEDYTGHDYLHVERVWKLARRIARACHADTTIVELAALFHDISDYKLNGGSETAGPEKARRWISTHTGSRKTADTVAQIILDIPFRGALSPGGPPLSLEARCVQDADRLDAIGAIGIARAFAFGGALKQPMISAGITPQLHSSFDDYKRKNGTTVNHFYEKLLLLSSRMNTALGREIAEERHAFMISFLRQLSNETEIKFGLEQAN